MTIKDQKWMATLLCEHFVRPVKEDGASSDDIAGNAMRFIQDFLRKEKGVAEMVSFFEVSDNPVAGSEFLDELRINY